jgi:hypothetical protein
LEEEEVADFGWWRAREMRKYAEETRFDGGYRDGSERGDERGVGSGGVSRVKV